MLLSISLIIFTGLSFSKLADLLKLPKLIGMLLAGILLGPFVLDLIAPELNSISLDIRYMALTVILLRAGLSLNMKALMIRKKEVTFLSFLPAMIEIIGALLLGPLLLGFTILESLLLGSILAAVSPAVIVPKMLEMMKAHHGTKRAIPQMILASASLDDIVVIVLFTSFLKLSLGESLTISTILSLPISLLLGILSGILLGLLCVAFFKKFHVRDSIKVLLILAVGFLMITFERENIIPYSGLIGIMTLGMTILLKSPEVSKRLVLKYEKLWIFFELLLFVLIGAALDLSNVLEVGANGLLLILGLLIFRILGVFIATLSSDLTLKERLFVGISYIPKATVQASIASIPLSLGITNGNTMLTIGVLSILITAPLGAFLIEKTKQHLITIVRKE